MIDNPSHENDFEKSDPDPDPEVTIEQDGVEKAVRRNFQRISNGGYCKNMMPVRSLVRRELCSDEKRSNPPTLRPGDGNKNGVNWMD
jgi:hypothetical protein